MQRAVIFTSALLTTTLSFAFQRPHSLQRITKHHLHKNIATTSSRTINMMAIDKPYGSWESPITSKAITAGSVKFGGVYYSNNQVYWLEGRPQEGGRNVLVQYAPSNPNKNERNGIDISPTDSNVRTRVHEYGGGALVMRNGNGGGIYYSEFTSQKLRKLILQDGSSSSKPIPSLNEEKVEEENRYRYADGVLSSNGHVIYCVREDHKYPEPSKVVNEIISIDVRDGYTKVLATGNDFYAHPRVSSNGKKLAYITWNHPNMPWDSTELRVSDVYGEKSNESSDHKLIAGEDGDTSIIQPTYQGGRLYYISDKSGYYNIYRAGLDDKSILPMEADFGGSAPGWQLGQQGFTFMPGKNGRLVAQYNKDGKSVLLTADVSDGSAPATDIKEYSGEEDGLPMMFGGVVPGGDGDLLFMGGSPSIPTSIYKWNIDSKEKATILACSSSLTFPEEVISVPKQVEFPTTLGSAFGYYYAPKNGKYKCTTDKAPPLLVKAHGGPTACTGSSFNAGIQVRYLRLKHDFLPLVNSYTSHTPIILFSIGPVVDMLYWT